MEYRKNVKGFPWVKVIVGLLVFAILATTSSVAVVKKETPLYWPENDLIPIQLSNKKVMADGLQFTIAELSNSRIALYSTSMSEWKLTSSLTHRKASVAFSNLRNPAIKTGVSIVNSKDWLGALSEDSLNRYVAGIQNLHSGRFTHLNSQTRFAPIQGSGFLLGKPYKMVHYRLVSEDDPTIVTEIRDFITQIGDTLIILSFECPQNLALRTSGSALTMLASLSRLDKPE